MINGIEFYIIINTCQYDILYLIFVLAPILTEKCFDKLVLHEKLWGEFQEIPRHPVGGKCNQEGYLRILEGFYGLHYVQHPIYF